MAKHGHYFDIRGAVNYAMSETNFDAKRARDLLKSLADDDESLRNELLFLGADQAIRSYFTSARRAETSSGDVELYTPRKTPETPEKQQARQRKIERRLFWDRYALFGQTPLKVAGRQDLHQSELARRKMAKGNVACADFEADLMRRMKDDKVKVGDFFAITKVVELAKAHGVL